MYTALVRLYLIPAWRCRQVFITHDDFYQLGGFSVWIVVAREKNMKMLPCTLMSLILCMSTRALTLSLSFKQSRLWWGAFNN
jgi:hypothetical protein